MEHASCCICFDSNQFRVLQCGHTFCLDCLQAIHQNHGGKIPCPLDRKEDGREPHTLPTPTEYEGQLFVQTFDAERPISFNQLIDAQVQHRMQTIRQLRKLAGNLDTNEFNCAIAKITGSVAGIAGSVMTIVGISLSFTGVGAVVGVPLALAGAGIGVAGGATTGLTFAVEQLLQKYGIEEVQKDLSLDHFKAQQIQVLLVRAAVNPQLAERWQIDASQIIGESNILPRLAKLGVTTAAGVRLAYGIGRASTTVGLHVAGLVLAAAIIPLDLAQIVVSSIKVHKKEPSKVVNDIRKMADDLEKQLRIYLIVEGHFQLVYTNSGQWMYIVISSEMMQHFKDRLEDGFAMEQLKRFGEIIESGEGDVPSEVRKKIQDEWYSHYDEVMAEALEEQLTY